MSEEVIRDGNFVGVGPEWAEVFVDGQMRKFKAYYDRTSDPEFTTMRSFTEDGDFVHEVRIRRAQFWSYKQLGSLGALSATEGGERSRLLDGPVEDVDTIL